LPSFPGLEATVNRYVVLYLVTLLVIVPLDFLFLGVVAVYLRTLSHGFIWDDNSIIVDNPIFDKLSNIPKFFLIEDTIDGISSGYYRPITYASFALERAIWGMNPLGLNINNLFLHILVTLLFYRVVAALFKRENLAFVAALIFALHPIAGETINFHAGGRNTLLSACFALLSLLYYIKRKPVPSTIWFLLAIFSKEFALLLPIFFVLYDTRIEKVKFRFAAYAPFVVCIIIYLVLRMFVLPYF
jgi:hypothetical protein